MTRLLLLIIPFLSIPQMGNTQNTNLFKKWVMNKTYDCSGKKINKLNETYWNVVFKQDGVATILINDNLKTDKIFTFTDDSINLEFAEYEISKISKDSLVLIDSKRACINYLFLSESADKLSEYNKREILKKQSNKYFIYKGDTVYSANSFNSPKMKNYPNHMMYFTMAFRNTNPRKDCIIQFKFIVQKDGKLLAPNGSISCSKKSEKIVKRIIKGMENQWQPMYISGRPVNALVRVKYRAK